MAGTAVVAVFDGHNDALTRPDHADLASGRAGGHLDLPRMRAGGVRGAMFAVFTASPDADRAPAPGAGGSRELAQPSPIGHEHAAADADAVIGRLLALERAGELRIARAIGDLDA